MKRYSLVLRPQWPLSVLVPGQVLLDYVPTMIDEIINSFQSMEDWHNWPGAFVVSSLNGVPLSTKNFDLDDDTTLANSLQINVGSKNYRKVTSYLHEIIENPDGSLVLFPWPHLPPSHYWIDRTKNWQRFSLKKIGVSYGEKTKHAFNYIYQDEYGNKWRQNFCDCWKKYDPGSPIIRDKCDYSQLQPITNDKFDVLKRKFEIKLSKRQQNV